MMQAALLAHGHHFLPLDDHAPLPPLKPLLCALSDRVPRRLDRFIELALLGALRCAQRQALERDCGIYLASACGPLGSTIAAQQQILRDRQWPRPLDFINTLGSSAGFHVAALLGLQGPNLFVSRRHGQLPAALEAALADLAAGACSQALVGVVEETPLPLAEHRRRLGVAADTALAEGSHWLLVSPRPPHTGERGIQLQSWQAHSELDALLPEVAGNTRVCLATNLARETHRHLSARDDTVLADTAAGALHASPAAAWLGAALDDSDNTDLSCVTATEVLRITPRE